MPKCDAICSACGALYGLVSGDKCDYLYESLFIANMRANLRSSHVLTNLSEKTTEELTTTLVP